MGCSRVVSLWPTWDGSEMSLKTKIAAEIEAGGPITVARFMERALYEPILGYYSSGAPRAGHEWFTGPTLHPIFGWTLARGIAPLLAQLDEPLLLDVGTGGGQLARDLVFGVAQYDEETFGRLEILLADRSDTGLASAVSTMSEAGIDLKDVSASSELPARFSGVLVANELLDAIPTHLCEATAHGPVELHVGLDDAGRLTMVPGKVSDPTVLRLAERRWSEVPPGTRFEVPTPGLEWYETACKAMARGAMVMIDYGETTERLSKEHHRGTLHGYHEGLRVPEFYLNPGLQDITYLVPFDLFREAGEAAGMTTGLYATQGEVLEALGIREIASKLASIDELAVKKLVDPGGAGGTFKVLVQSKGVDVGGPWPV